MKRRRLFGPLLVLVLFVIGCGGSGSESPAVAGNSVENAPTIEPTVWPRLQEFEALAKKQCQTLTDSAPSEVATILKTLDEESQQLKFDMQAVRGEVRSRCRAVYDAIFAAQPTATPPPTRVPTQAPAPPLLLERGWKCDRSSQSYAELSGQVTNRGTTALRNVQVIVTYYTSDKTFIASDSALIEYEPLLPGQTSPFSVLTRYNPAIAQCDIGFKTIGGAVIPYEERP